MGLNQEKYLGFALLTASSYLFYSLVKPRYHPDIYHLTPILNLDIIQIYII